MEMCKRIELHIDIERQVCVVVVITALLVSANVYIAKGSFIWHFPEKAAAK